MVRTIHYTVLALDTVMAEEGAWITKVLRLAAYRADAHVVHALPLLGFDLVRMHLDAFRLLQRGGNVGKVVLHLAHSMTVTQALGMQIITGGTGGLGFATGGESLITGDRRLW